MSGGVDLSVRDQLDADSLVFYMLSTDPYPDGLEPTVLAEVDLGTDAEAMLRPVVIYSCGPPEQFTSNLKAWHWRFALSLTVMARDARTAFRLAARVNRNVANWPWRDTDHQQARVARVPDNSGFQRVAPGETANSKITHTFVAEKTIQAATPRCSG